jgi:hypothetical protein
VKGVTTSEDRDIQASAECLTEASYQTGVGKMSKSRDQFGAFANTVTAVALYLIITTAEVTDCSVQSTGCRYGRMCYIARKRGA